MMELAQKQHVMMKEVKWEQQTWRRMLFCPRKTLLSLRYLKTGHVYKMKRSLKQNTDGFWVLKHKQLLNPGGYSTWWCSCIWDDSEPTLTSLAWKKTYSQPSSTLDCDSEAEWCETLRKPKVWLCDCAQSAPDKRGQCCLCITQSVVTTQGSDVLL